MARGLSSELVTALSADHLHLAYLVDFAFDSGTQRLWTGVGDLDLGGGVVYAGCGSADHGGFLSIKPGREATQPAGFAAEIEIGDVGSGDFVDVLSEDYQGRDLLIRLGVFDADGALIVAADNPLQIFRGRMDIIQIADNGRSSRLKLTAESRLADFDRPRSSFYNHATQLALHPGDRAFEFVSQMQLAELAIDASPAFFVAE